VLLSFAVQHEHCQRIDEHLGRDLVGNRVGNGHHELCVRGESLSPRARLRENTDPGTGCHVVDAGPDFLHDTGGLHAGAYPPRRRSELDGLQIAPVNREQGHADYHLTRTRIAGFVHVDEFDHVDRIARLLYTAPTPTEPTLPHRFCIN